MEFFDIIIIGTGPAGLTSGIFSVRRALKTIVFGDTYSLPTLSEATIVDDYPCIPNISGPELLMKFEEHAKSLEVLIRDEKVLELKKDGKEFVIKTEKGEYKTKTIIMATGTRHRKVLVTGEEKFAGKGVSYCANCVPAGTEIIVNYGLKIIEDIENGINVLTHKGEFKPILKTFKNRYSGKMIKIDTRYFRDVYLSLTPNHEVLAVKIKRCDKLGTAKFVCKKHCNIQKLFNCPKYYLQYSPQWIPAGRLTTEYMLLYPRIRKIKNYKTIKISDFVNLRLDEDGYAHNKTEIHTSVRISNKIPVNSSFMRLAGYYLSKGCITNRGVTFSFNSKEREYIKDAKSIIKELFGIDATVKTVGNVTYIHTFSCILLKFFKELFGKYAHKKHIPQWMIYLPHKKQYELIRAMWAGDGCKRKKDFSYITTSKILAYQLKNIMLRLGVMVTTEMKTVEQQNKTPGIIEGRKIYSKHDKFTVVIKGPFLVEMSKILDIEHEYIKKRNRTLYYTWFDKNFAYVPIKSITQHDYDGFVYNLMVKDDNSYITRNSTLHNCDGPLFRNKKTLVVGGGDTAATYAILLDQIGSDTILIHRRDELRAVETFRKQLKKSGVKILWNTILKEIKGDKFVKSVVVQNVKTKEIKEIKMDGVFIGIGTTPMSELAKNLGIKIDEMGFIVVDKEQRTNVPGVFAAGDCCDNVTKRIITACGDGSIAAEVAYNYIKENE